MHGIPEFYLKLKSALFEYKIRVAVFAAAYLQSKSRDNIPWIHGAALTV